MKPVKLFSSNAFTSEKETSETTCEIYGAESVPKIEIFYEGEIFRDIPR